MKIYKWLLLTTFLFSLIFAHGQEGLEWYANNVAKEKLIGLEDVDEGAYLIRSKEGVLKRFVLEFIDWDGQIVSKEITGSEFKCDSAFLYDWIICDEVLYLACVNYREGSANVEMVGFNQNLELVNSQVLVEDLSYSRSSLTAVDLNIEASFDSFGSLVLSSVDNYRQEHLVVIFDKNMELVNSKVVDVPVSELGDSSLRPFEEISTDVEWARATSRGGVLLAVSTYLKVSNPDNPSVYNKSIVETKVLAYDGELVLREEWGISIDNLQLQLIEGLRVDNDHLVLAGVVARPFTESYFNSKLIKSSSKESLGVCHVFIDLNASSFDYDLLLFDDDRFDDFKVDLERYKVVPVRLARNNEGKFISVYEKQAIEFNQNTGIVYRRYNDVLLSSFEFGEEVDWCLTIKKEQGLYNSEAVAGSVLVALNDSRVSIVFNDNSKNYSEGGFDSADYEGVWALKKNVSIVQYLIELESGIGRREQLFKVPNGDPTFYPLLSKASLAGEYILFYAIKGKKEQFGRLPFGE